jgi:Salt tolerance down-regulator
MPAKTKKAGNVPSTSSRPSPSNPNNNLSNSKTAPPPTVTSKTHSSPSGEGRAEVRTTEVAELARQGSDNAASQPTVNRKKQKRREKEAAKKAAEQSAENEILAQNGYASTVRGSTRSYFREETEGFHPGYLDEAGDIDDAFYSGAEDQTYGHQDLLRNGFEEAEQAVNGLGGKKKKKSKKRGPVPGLSENPVENSNPVLRGSTPMTRPHLPPTPSLSAAALHSARQNFTHDQIWNTSTQAERENIKQFWLQLGEEERRSLVKVEKEAVLRKMKEQQKHSCSCTVCGRKRTAIEEELEVLYDAYYEELEQFANHNNDLSNGAAILNDSRMYSHLRTQRHPMAGQFPIERTGHDRIEDDEDLEDDEYDDEEDAYSDDDIEEIPRGPPDFFTFGNSLTVKGKLTKGQGMNRANGSRWDFDGGGRPVKE